MGNVQFLSSGPSGDQKAKMDQVLEELKHLKRFHNENTKNLEESWIFVKNEPQKGRTPEEMSENGKRQTIAWWDPVVKTLSFVSYFSRPSVQNVNSETEPKTSPVYEIKPDLSPVQSTVNNVPTPTDLPLETQIPQPVIHLFETKLQELQHQIEMLQSQLPQGSVLHGQIPMSGASPGPYLNGQIPMNGTSPGPNLNANQFVNFQSGPEHSPISTISLLSSQNDVYIETNDASIPPPPPPPSFDVNNVEKKVKNVGAKSQVAKEKTREMIVEELKQLIAQSDILPANYNVALQNFLQTFPESLNHHLQMLVEKYPMLIRKFPLQPKTCFNRMRWWEKNLFKDLEEAQANSLRRSKVVEIEKMETEEQVLEDIQMVKKMLELQRQKQEENRINKEKRDTMGAVLEELKIVQEKGKQQETQMKAQQEISLMETGQIELTDSM